MKVVDIAENIFRIENILPDEFYNLIMDKIAKSTEEDWQNNHVASFWYGNAFQHHRFTQEFAILAKRINSFFPDPNLRYDPFIKLFRTFPGQETLGTHNDNVSGQHWNVWGTTTYLNDNFEGGELVYTDLNISLKPIPNSTVIHKADINHCVNPVLSGGPRYVIVSQIQDCTIPQIFPEQTVDYRFSLD